MDVDFTSLEVWKLSHELMLDVYAFAKLLPPSEKYKRVDQLERSSSSVPACRKARGSLAETKNHVIAVRGLDQAPLKECDKLIEKCDRIRQVLNGYIRYLKKQKVENDAD